MRLTKIGIELIKKRLRNLNEQREMWLSEVIRTSELPGDDKIDFFNAKKELERVDESVYELTNILSTAQDIKPCDNDTVSMGNIVTMDRGDQDSEQYQLVSAEEIRYRKLDATSVESPLGSELLGKRVGDVFEIIVNEEIIEYTITNINNSKN